MAVYVLGKTIGSVLFDNRSPPTQPGFMIHEPAVIVITAMSLAAVISYSAIRRKRLDKDYTYTMRFIDAEFLQLSE